jgi:tetratricopeptide (TPR) repeat protein
MGHLIGEAEGLGSLGVSLKAQGKLVESRQYQEEALLKFQQLNILESVQWLLGELGHTALNLGDYAEAEARYTAAIAIAEKLGQSFFRDWWGVQLAALRTTQGRPDEALHLVETAFATSVELDNTLLQQRALFDWGNVLLAQGEWAAATDKYQQVVDAYLAVEQTEQATPALGGLALAAFEQGQVEQAAVFAEQVWQVWQDNPAIAQRADLRLYRRIGTVWDGLQDRRSAELWQTAYNLLEERTQHISDANLRELFRRQVPAHRAIELHQAAR